MMIKFEIFGFNVLKKKVLGERKYVKIEHKKILHRILLHFELNEWQKLILLINTMHQFL